MILKFPKPWDMSEDRYVLLCNKNAKAQGLELDTKTQQKLSKIIQKRILNQAESLGW